jgi:hypothetical protein
MTEHWRKDRANGNIPRELTSLQLIPGSFAGACTLRRSSGPIRTLRGWRKLWETIGIIFRPLIQAWHRPNMKQLQISITLEAFCNILWRETGFGLVIGVTEHFYSSSLHVRDHCHTKTKSSQSRSSLLCLVTILCFRTHVLAVWRSSRSNPLLF